MRALRFINHQWANPDGKWPYKRTAMFTVMDEQGRAVVSKSQGELGEAQESHTYYHNNLTQQDFYPLSARRKT